MHYVCIENNVIVSILSYEPNVPDSVTVYPITDEQATQIQDQTHFFDLNSKAVVEMPTEVLAEKDRNLANGGHREFLNSTDWQVLRHLREKTLGLLTSLTEEEFINLEQQRQTAASSIE